MRFLSFYFKNGRSGRIMSEPLRANFLPEHIIFRKECQCKIKILNFCIGCFHKINLSKRDNLSKCDIFFFKFIMSC